jgi:hypothetical protein
MVISANTLPCKEPEVGPRSRLTEVFLGDAEICMVCIYLCLVESETAQVAPAYATASMFGVHSPADTSSLLGRGQNVFQALLLA